MAYDVFSIDKMQINASGLRKFARKCISESNSRVSIMAKPYITGVYDLSKILYENNPHVYLNPTEKLRMGEYVKDGDCYIVGPNLMIWDSTTNMWIGISISAGPSGETATIEVGSTRTGDESSEALALDNAVGNHHVFDFVIPRGNKGESGPTGPKGDKGDTGPIGSLVLTSYDAVCFASFKDSNTVGTSTITTTRIIPGNSDILSISGNQIKVLRTSVFEITLCGRISGVTNDTGVSFIYIILLLVRKLVIWNLFLIKEILVIWIFLKLILLMFMLVEI